jgi:hypothetical protein
VAKNQWFRLAAGTGWQQESSNLVKPRFDTDMRKNFFSVRARESWNKVPDKIKMARNVGQVQGYL